MGLPDMAGGIARGVPRYFDGSRYIALEGFFATGWAAHTEKDLLSGVGVDGAGFLETHTKVVQN